MSCSLYRYSAACDGRPCAGDCDLCDFDPEEAESIGDIADGLFSKIMNGDFTKGDK